MTVMQTFGAVFIAFGPAFFMFIFTIAKDPLKIIIMIAGAFFWLLSLFLSSALWSAVVPLKDEVIFALIFSVIFQEAFRFAYYKLLRKADEGLRKFGQNDQSVIGKHAMGYVSGYGFGIMSALCASVNVLSDSTGPGTVGITGASSDFLLTTALMTCCLVLLHTFWGILFFYGFDNHNYLAVFGVIASHLLISCLTLLNEKSLYEASLIPAYLMMLVMGTSSFFVAGGSLKNIRAMLSCATSNYRL